MTTNELDFSFLDDVREYVEHYPSYEVRGRKSLHKAMRNCANANLHFTEWRWLDGCAEKWIAATPSIGDLGAVNLIYGDDETRKGIMQAYLSGRQLPPPIDTQHATLHVTRSNNFSC